MAELANILETWLNSLFNLLRGFIDGQPERTKFYTVQVPARANVKGLPLGTGACRGVIVKINQGVLNNPTTQAANELRACYIGDSDAQNWELTTELSVSIPCRDLSEIFVRNGFAVNGVTQFLQVQVFLGRDDIVTINPALTSDQQ